MAEFLFSEEQKREEQERIQAAQKRTLGIGEALKITGFPARKLQGQAEVTPVSPPERFRKIMEEAKKINRLRSRVTS
jgi:hypothetical protein